MSKTAKSIATVATIGSLPVIRPAIQTRLTVLVYGYAGIGKTVFAASAVDDPRSSPVLYLDFEAGTLSIRDKPVDVIRITDFRQFNEIYEYLSSPESPYKTVVLDSITEIQKLNLWGIVSAAARADPRRDPDRPHIEDWGKSASQMRRLLRYFRDLPIHVIVTALPQEVRDDRDGSVQVKPSLSGKLADEAAGMFDIVGYLGTRAQKEADGEESVVRVMVVQPIGKFVAKDRSGTLGDTIESPTVSKLLDAALGPATPASSH